MYFRLLIVGFICIVFSSYGYATEPLKTLPTLPSSPVYLIKMVVGLVTVLLLFYAFAWLARRFGMGGLMPTTNRDLKILESLSLGTREKLVIVQAGDEKLLLGITSGSIRKIHSMDADSDKKSDFSNHLTRQQEKQ